MSDLVLVPTAQSANADELAGRRVAVIDVLRATTVILAALERGASRVLTVADLDEARLLRSKLPRALLAGERGGFAPEGFDYGNSPVEISAADLAGRIVVLTTTNGTLAVQRAQTASSIFAACLRNASAVAGAFAAAGGPIALLCAGTEGAFTIEDFYCAGLIARALCLARLRPERPGLVCGAARGSARRRDRQRPDVQPRAHPDTSGPERRRPLLPGLRREQHRAALREGSGGTRGIRSGPIDAGRRRRPGGRALPETVMPVR